MKTRDEGAPPIEPAPPATDAAIAADEAVLHTSRQHTRRSFAVLAAGAAAGFGFWEYLHHSRLLGDLHAPLRRALQADARLSRALFDDRVLAPTYPLSRAETLRVNGVYGLKEQLAPESWRLQLVGVEGAATRKQYVPDVTAWEYQYTAGASEQDRGHDTKVKPSADTAEKMSPAQLVGHAMGLEQRHWEQRAGAVPRGKEEAGESRSTLAPGTPGLLLTIADITALPKRELVTQFKCIEGWSQVVHWGGVRFADLIDAYPPASRPDGSLPRYVYMETPNGDYYVGYDLHLCRHPQTLLVTEMSGQPLTQFHGAPLRLHTPAKYGYKQIKRIGLIAYTDEKPDDYWTKLGYDWYAGL